jgi:hypothetical protein
MLGTSEANWEKRESLNVSPRTIMKTKMKLVLSFCAVIVVGLLFTEGLMVPKQLQPNVLPLAFKEYRDETPLLGLFELRNESSSPVVVWPAATLIAHRETGKERQQIIIERTVVPENETRTVTVEAPMDRAWQVEFRVSRFGAREERRIKGGKPVQGTIVYSKMVPAYEPKL